MEKEIKAVKALLEAGEFDEDRDIDRKKSIEFSNSLEN